MKKIFILSVIALSGLMTKAQYFQATFANTANKLIFKLKPTADITKDLAYIEIAFRYNTAATPPFTITNITSNSANFPGLNMQRLADYTDGTYTYVKFAYAAQIASKTYVGGTEYELLTLTLDGTPAFADLELASDLTDPNLNYVFGVVDGNSNLLDPGTGDQFYGPGFNKVGEVNILPLNDVPVPVKFIDFTVTKKDNGLLLNWAVANESAITDRYEVERSSNGVDFVKVYTIPYVTSTGSANTYQQTDATAAGTVYYRIKQIDKDGKYIYSVIKTFRITTTNLGINLSPNPVKDVTKLTLELTERTPVSIKITDASGKEMKTIQMQGNKGTNIKQIDLSTFASGNYMMKVVAGSENKTIPVVKLK